MQPQDKYINIKNKNMIYLIILVTIAILTLIGIKIKKITEVPESPTVTTTQAMDCSITGSAAQTNLKTKVKK